MFTAPARVDAAPAPRARTAVLRRSMVAGALLATAVGLAAPLALGFTPDSGVTMRVAALAALSGAGIGSPVDGAEVVQRLGALGGLGDGAAARFEASAFEGLVPADPHAPFTGSGASGVSALRASLPLADLVTFVQHHRAEQHLAAIEREGQRLDEEKVDRPAGSTREAERARREAIRLREVALIPERREASETLELLELVVGRYRNPISQSIDAPLGDPLAGLSVETRRLQARLLLTRPLVTLHRGAYGDRLPTRAEVVSAAAQRYRLDPAVLAGVLLQEQRDQSRAEDAAELAAATLAGRNNSLGLGQVSVSTAMADGCDLLADTVGSEARARLSHTGVAELLLSEEHNIFAVARYLRRLADFGATLGSEALVLARTEMPGLDPSAFRGASWPDDNVRALASEYTTTAWDGLYVAPEGYPGLVLEAVRDVRHAGFFAQPSS